MFKQGLMIGAFYSAGAVWVSVACTSRQADITFLWCPLWGQGAAIPLMHFRSGGRPTRQPTLDVSLCLSYPQSLSHPFIGWEFSTRLNVSCVLPFSHV